MKLPNPLSAARFAFAVVVTVMVAAHAAAAPEQPGTRRQDFAADPGWEGFRNRLLPDPPPVTKQDFGFRDTNHAKGKQPGEIGGWVNRSAEPAWYAKKIPEKTLDDRLSASGRFAVTEDNSNSGTLFGWFNSNSRGWRAPNALVFRVDGNGGKFWVFYEYGTRNMRTAGAGAFEGERYQTTPTKPFKADGTPHDWKLDYDPDANGGNGLVTFVLDGTEYKLPLEPGHKADGATFDRFGMFNQQTSGSGTRLYFDDVVLDGEAQDFKPESGWEGRGNEGDFPERFYRPLHDFGHAATAQAGGAVWRNEAPAYYADKVGPLSLEHELFASGKVVLSRASSDSGVYVGWFDSQSKRNKDTPDHDEPLGNYLAVMVEGPSRIGHYFRAAYASANGEGVTDGEGPVIFPDGKPHDWSIHYDPKGAEGRGRITVTFDEQTRTMDLRPADRKRGATFDRFGLFNSQSGGAFVELYVDDLTYTAASPAGARAAALDPATTHDPNLYLFVDDHWVAKSHGLKRVLGEPQVMEEPILFPEDPRTERDCAWGSVIRRPGGRFRMWYCTMMMGHHAGGGHEMAKAGVWGKGEDFGFYPRSEQDVREVHNMLGKYADSADGFTWKKRHLGMIEFRGRKDNNIILDGVAASKQSDGALTNFDGYTVVRDDAEPDDQKRYKMLAHWESVHFWDNNPVSGALGRPESAMQKYGRWRGKYITYSPDGLRWKQPLKRIDFPDGGGDRFLVIRDHRNERWWGYSRAGHWGFAALSTSKDLENWSEPVAEKELSRDPEKYPAIECLIPFNYGNQDLGFVVGMDKPKGILLSYLVSHRDGEPWKWVERERPFIPAGGAGSYHATGAVPLHNEPFVVGDKLLIFFNAFAYHQEQLTKAGARSIGLATLRRDGFVGLKSVDDGAELVTKVVKVTGPRLYLNVDKDEASGGAAVELLRPNGTPIEGYRMEEAVFLGKGGVRRPVGWADRDDVRALLGEEVAVRVSLPRGNTLYSIAFGK